MSSPNDSRTASQAQEPDEAQEPEEFARVLSATHAELLAVASLLHESAAQLTVVHEALRSALQPRGAPDHAGSLLADMREIRARMLQRLTR